MEKNQAFIITVFTAFVDGFRECYLGENDAVYSYISSAKFFLYEDDAKHYMQTLLAKNKGTNFDFFNGKSQLSTKKVEINII